MLDWHKCAILQFNETSWNIIRTFWEFSIQPFLPVWIFMFSNKIFPTPMYCRCSIKKRVLWSNKFEKWYSRVWSVFTTSPVPERYVDEIMDMKWWSRKSSEVGLQAGGEVMSCRMSLLSPELIWDTLWQKDLLLGDYWRNMAAGFWQGIHSRTGSLICHHSALWISLSETERVGCLLQLRITSHCM